jgi:hypothetical protein
MEGSYSTGQSPQWAVVPVQEEEEDIYILWPIPEAAQSKVWVCGSSLPGTVCSNLARSMEVCGLSVLCVIRLSFLRWADHSSRGVLPNVVCPSVIVKTR